MLRFLWLWRIAAWSMGFSLLTYGCLVVSGSYLRWCRCQGFLYPSWLRPLHIGMGSVLTGLVLVLFAIGIIGTLGHYGNLAHSFHFLAGLTVVALVFASLISAIRINHGHLHARTLHLTINLILGLGFASVSLTGWQVVQKYLP